ncbi:PadR family transcriptional regulator [Trichocoleus desertorum AS-A10]|uniref:PadR family transcriptional regulator n=1 Tax=Trichocoleus desertorum TaxID=1481672 RepID=UPI00329992B8
MPLKNQPQARNKEPSELDLSALEELIMTSLLKQELYGLQIVQAIDEASNGRRKLAVGSLYPTLHRLEKKGFISSRWGDDRPEERGGARRRYYQLTGLGTNVLEAVQLLRINLSSWQPA